MLNGVFGGANADGTPDDRFEAALRELGGEPAFTEFNWYATLTVTSEVEVSDDLIEPVGFVFPRNAFDLADEAQASARDSLDALTAIASSCERSAGVQSSCSGGSRPLIRTRKARDRRPRP